MSAPQSLPEPSTVAPHVLEILQKDGNLPVCTACGTQYGTPTDTCVICEDPRQFVPASGQTWSSLTELAASRRNKILVDKEDERVKMIVTEPGFGINQTPIIIETAQGSYIWDTAAYISTALVEYLTTGLKSPLKGIAISHPHFFTTSLTWSRLLKVPLYLNEADKEWYARRDEIVEGEDQVVWWSGEKTIGQGVKLIQCGGHFPGSSVLHWDRSLDTSTATSHSPAGGLLLVADTVMVQSTQRGFTFIWSVPNLIPLGPQEVVSILHKLQSVDFAQATSTWPDRFIRRNAREVLVQSVKSHLRQIGWEWNGKAEKLVPV